MNSIQDGIAILRRRIIDREWFGIQWRWYPSPTEAGPLDSFLSEWRWRGNQARRAQCKVKEVGYTLLGGGGGTIRMNRHARIKPLKEDLILLFWIGIIRCCLVHIKHWSIENEVTLKSSKCNFPQSVLCSHDIILWSFHDNKKNIVVSQSQVWHEIYSAILFIDFWGITSHQLTHLANRGVFNYLYSSFQAFALFAALPYLFQVLKCTG